MKVAIVKNFSQFLNHVTTVSSEQLTKLKSDHFSFAKLVLLFLQLKTIERFHWVRFQFR